MTRVDIEIVLNTRNIIEYKFYDENGNLIPQAGSNYAFYIYNPENNQSKQAGTITGGDILTLDIQIDDDDPILTFNEDEDIAGDPPFRYSYVIEEDGKAKVRGKVRIIRAGK